MSTSPILPAPVFERIKRLDTCTVSNALERFNVRLRNEGYVHHGAARCLFPHLPPMLGYAVTARIRSSTAPINGSCYHDRIDFWRHVLTCPEPRVMVLQDADRTPGIGAFVGEIHANIALALNCIGCVTNGAVRDLQAIEAAGFHLFARAVTVSHAYAHIVDFGDAVEIGCLKIHPGDLIHGDAHGVQVIPMSIAAQIPQTAEEILEQEQHLIGLCRSQQFSLDALAEELRQVKCGVVTVHAEK